MHADRCDAVADSLPSGRAVVGIELFASSADYAWNAESRHSFEKVTLFTERHGRGASVWAVANGIVATCRKKRASDVFLCNHDRPEILLAGLLLRALGRRVFVMGCSKFDDMPRFAWRESAKRLFFLPYQGAIASGSRSRDYMRFLGIPEARIETEYNTLSIARIRRMAEAEPAPAGTAFADRHFTVVARFVPKKNLPMVLEAYARYRQMTVAPRDLHLCGSGPLEAELREKARSLGVAGNVVFRGFLQTDAVSRVLAGTLALLLPSIEEQFGNVVIEAQAMGLPVILSDACGARDNLVRSGVNGFVVEPDNPEGLAVFMAMLSEDEALWKRQSLRAREAADKGDVARFAEAVLRLCARGG